MNGCLDANVIKSERKRGVGCGSAVFFLVVGRRFMSEGFSNFAEKRLRNR